MSVPLSRRERFAAANIDKYDTEWLVDKNGYLSPAQARQAWDDAMSLKAAA